MAIPYKLFLLFVTLIRVTGFVLIVIVAIMVLCVEIIFQIIFRVKLGASGALLDFARDFLSSNFFADTSNNHQQQPEARLNAPEEDSPDDPY